MPISMYLDTVRNWPADATGPISVAGSSGSPTT